MVKYESMCNIVWRCTNEPMQANSGVKKIK